MILLESAPIAFVPTARPEASRLFFERTLGLPLEKDDGFAMVFRTGPEPAMRLRVVRMGEFVPAPFTILGWAVASIATAVDELAARGVTLTRFEGLTQDARGVWTSPDGSKVAWFRDADGNTLSISEYA